MKNAKSLLNFKKVIVILLILSLLLSPLMLVNTSAFANETVEAETVYYDDDEVYNGTGTHVDDSYQVSYDELVYDVQGYPSAPSLGIHDSSLQNACATVAGANIVTFYDRFYSELVPDYTPGVMTPMGFYMYYPDRGLTPTVNLVSTLHSLMNSSDGTTENEFKSGLESYASSKGRSVSYTSFYNSSTNVNLSVLDTAFSQNKVGIIMCSTYNFVLGISNPDGMNVVNVVKQNSQVGHMMMVYGYEIYNYYVGGALVRTDTFLSVSSGYADGSQGYILLNDDLTIDKAYVVTIA